MTSGVLMNGSFVAKIEAGEAKRIYESTIATTKLTNDDNSPLFNGRSNDNGKDDNAKIVPSNTMILRFEQPFSPSDIPNKGEWTEWNAANNEWAWTFDYSDWENHFSEVKIPFAVVEVGDLSQVTTVANLFSDSSITAACDMKILNATSANGMFENCHELTKLPKIIFGDSLMESISMFSGCENVKEGILAQYNEMKNLPTLSIYARANTFGNCGSNTATGLAELKQIPIEWGGLLN